MSIMIHKTAQIRGSLKEKTHQFLMYNKEVSLELSSIEYNENNQA